MTWIEDVRKWHPGQDWIWKPGGFGVFDPGINALSLASLLFPGPLTVSKAELDYPSNSDTPIAAILSLMTTDHVPIEVILNWRTEGEERWERSEEHTSALQSLMRISYAVFCLKKKNKT